MTERQELGKGSGGRSIRLIRSRKDFHGRRCHADYSEKHFTLAERG